MFPRRVREREESSLRREKRELAWMLMTMTWEMMVRTGGCLMSLAAALAEHGLNGNPDAESGGSPGKEPGTGGDDRDVTVAGPETEADGSGDVVMRREGSALSEPEPAPSSGVEPAEPDQLRHLMPCDWPYGPVVRDIALSRAMRRDVSMLDMGRPANATRRQSGMEELCVEEVLVTEEAYMSENQKKRIRRKKRSWNTGRLRNRTKV